MSPGAVLYSAPRPRHSRDFIRVSPGADLYSGSRPRHSRDFTRVSLGVVLHGGPASAASAWRKTILFSVPFWTPKTGPQKAKVHYAPSPFAAPFLASKMDPLLGSPLCGLSACLPQSLGFFFLLLLFLRLFSCSGPASQLPRQTTAVCAKNPTKIRKILPNPGKAKSHLRAGEP